MRKANFILLFVTVAFIPLFSQHFAPQNLQSLNELTSNSVYAILRDSEGFLWIGTQNGLNRYDGEKFISYLHNPHDSTTLSDNFVLSLAEDSAGTIWVGTRHGLNFFDKRTEKFSHIFPLDLKQYPSHQAVTHVCYAKDQVIFASLRGTYFTASKQYPYSTLQSTFADSIVSVASDERGNVLLGKAGSIEIHFTNGKQKKIFLKTREYVGVVRHFGEEVYAGTSDGVFSIDLQTGTVQHFLSGKSVTAIERDNKSRVWIGTESGLFVVQYKDSILHILENHSAFNNLKSANVRSLFFDTAGLMWIGMIRDGIQQYDPTKEQFEIIERKNFANGVVWAYLRDKENFEWIGTQNGLYKKNKSGVFQKVFLREIENKMVGSIREDAIGNLWFTVRSNSLMKYSKQTRKLSIYTLNNFIHMDKIISITDILLAKSGSILISTTNGLFKFNPVDGKFISLPIHDPDRKGENLYFMHLFEDSRGRIWISSSHGVYLFTASSNSFQKFAHNARDTLSLSYDIVGSVMEDSKGRIWIATFGGGINYFNEAKKSFVRLTSRDGLANDVVYGIVEDSQQNLWMSTDNGISLFNPDTKKIRTYGKEDGLDFLEFSQNAFYKDSNGKIFFGGVGGIISFLPEKINVLQQPCFMYVSDLRINYQSLEATDEAIVKGTKTHPIEIHLLPHQRTLSIDFGLLDFRYRNNVSFAFRMHNYDEGWIVPANNQRTAHYTQLPSGTYLFEVKSSTHNTFAKDTTLRISVVVYPYFWEEWWFFTLCSLCVVGIASFITRYISQKRLKEQLREIELQKRVHEERERISRELHDNTGAQLAGIISGLNVAEKYLKSSRTKTKKTLLSLTEDARYGMRQLRETIWALKTEEMSVGSFFETAQEKIKKQIRFKKRTVCKFEILCSHNIILAPLQVLNMMRILQEGVMNALKHSSAKKIVFRFELIQNQFQLHIHNNGKVKIKDKNVLWHGEGILNMERRAKEIGGTFSIAMNNTMGTTITVTFPQQKRL